MFRKIVFLLVPIILITSSLSLGGAIVLAAPGSPSPQPQQPHTPGVRPSQPHIRLASPHAGEEESLNWAGYAVSGAAGSVTDVKGSWTIPNVSCTSSTTYAAFWAGIDGFTSSTVEQTGVLDECYAGAAYYYSWYEFYPSAPVYITSTVPVKAGDVIYAEVSYASSKFTATLTDETTKATYSVTVSVSNAKRSSAEWIAEAPSSSSGILPLANFQTAYYGLDYTKIASTSYATINGVTGALNSFGSSVYELMMVTRSLTVKAQPSAVTSDETSFTVTWKHS